MSCFCRSFSTAGTIAAKRVAVRCLPARKAVYAEPERPLPPELTAALAEMGIKQLYSHQARAVDLIRDGQNVVIVTSTASGKTLCYNLPVLESLLADPSTKALYLFPTKALAQDQLQGAEPMENADSVSAAGCWHL